MAQRSIQDFTQDEEGDWVALLECGHRQHVRHKPPLSERPWVLDPEGRRAHIGSQLDCRYCEQPRLPGGAAAYKRTPEFDENSVPDALRRDHHTKAGVWGRIVVLEGKLRYDVTGPPADSWVLSPNAHGIIAPRAAHSVHPVGKVRFYVEFLRLPA